MPATKTTTVPTKLSVVDYIKSLSADEQQVANELIAIFTATTNMKPVLWGSMIGFGSYHYKYDSGREGDMFATGFAMRKSGPTIYIMPGYQNYTAILNDLGPHKLGKSCLYIKNIEDINKVALKKLIRTGLKDLAKKYPVTSS